MVASSARSAALPHPLSTARRETPISRRSRDPRWKGEARVPATADRRTTPTLTRSGPATCSFARGRPAARAVGSTMTRTARARVACNWWPSPANRPAQAQSHRRSGTAAPIATASGRKKGAEPASHAPCSWWRTGGIGLTLQQGGEQAEQSHPPRRAGRNMARMAKVRGPRSGSAKPVRRRGDTGPANRRPVIAKRRLERPPPSCRSATKDRRKNAGRDAPPQCSRHDRRCNASSGTAHRIGNPAGAAIPRRPANQTSHKADKTRQRDDEAGNSPPMTRGFRAPASRVAP